MIRLTTTLATFMLLAFTVIILVGVLIIEGYL